MELSSLSAFISLCNAVIATGKHFANEQLSAKEERILAAACHTGVIELIKHEGFFAVFAEGTLFVGDDRMICAGYIDAFRRLCEVGSLVAEGDSVFTLTEKALDRGRRIAADQQTFDASKAKLPYMPFLTDLEVQLLSNMFDGNYCDCIADPAESPTFFTAGKITISAKRDPQEAGRLFQLISSLERFCARGWATSGVHTRQDGRKFAIYRLTSVGAKLVDLVRSHPPAPVKKVGT